MLPFVQGHLNYNNPHRLDATWKNPKLTDLKLTLLAQLVNVNAHYLHGVMNGNGIPLHVSMLKDRRSVLFSLNPEHYTLHSTS